ncbi:MAG: methyltransferase domain-containing protein, partial [Nitrospirae bacterium]
AAFLEAAGLETDFAVACEPYRERDWQEAFRQGFEPVAVGGRLVVAPSWWEGPLPEAATVLRIDPQMAFGTGHHPTTRACLAWLVARAEAAAGRPGSLLDAGCGSGVLAIAGHRLGFAPVTAVDSDPVACATARRNAAANGAAVAVVEGDLARASLAPAATVVANLTAGAILALLPRLLAWVAPGGRLLLAGILAEREREVAQAVAAAGGRPRRYAEEAGWVALECVSPRERPE